MNSHFTQWAIFDPLWRVCWRGRGNAGLFKVEVKALGNLFYFINENIQSIPTLRRTVNTYWPLDRYYRQFSLFVRGKALQSWLTAIKHFHPTLLCTSCRGVALDFEGVRRGKKFESRMSSRLRRSGDMFPQKIFKLRGSEMPFPVFFKEMKQKIQ